MKSTLCTLLSERHPRELRLGGDDKWSELASGQKRNIDIQMLLLLYQEGKCRVSCPGCCIIGLEPLGTNPNQHHPNHDTDRPPTEGGSCDTYKGRPAGQPCLICLNFMSSPLHRVQWWLWLSTAPTAVVLNASLLCFIDFVVLPFLLRQQTIY